MRGEEPEQIELPCREHDLVAGLSHLACVSVEHHVSEGDAAPRLGLRRGAAEQRTDTGRELPGGERLGDVVVRAELQTDDAIHFLAACRQQDDRQRRARADGAAERDPVLAREHDVEDHEVELLFSEQLVGAVSVFGDERAMAVPLEVAHDDVADDRVVVTTRMVAMSLIVRPWATSRGAHGPSPLERCRPSSHGGRGASTGG